MKLCSFDARGEGPFQATLLKNRSKRGKMGMRNSQVPFLLAEPPR
jgi:hypothetical protein